MISPGTDASGSSLPRTAHSISRACGTAASTTILRSNSAARLIAVRSSAACFAFEMPTLDPRFAGFTNTGKPRRSTTRLQHRALVALPVALQHDLVVADRQALGGEHELHRRLVHADRRREHAGADVRHVGQLEQPLHRAVLAVRAVQHGKHDVERRGRRRRGRASPAVRSMVSSVSPPGCATRCASRPVGERRARRARAMTSAADIERRRLRRAAPSGRPSRSGSATAS